MTLGGLTARVARLETADAAACRVCQGNALRLEWIDDAGARGPGPRAAADVPQTCAGCGRPVHVVRFSWLTDDDEASR